MSDVVSQVLRRGVEWPRPVAEVASRLHAAGVLVHAVGGAVRDALLGRASHDWDFATAARPDVVAALLPLAKAVDLRLGAVHLDLDDHYSDRQR